MSASYLVTGATGPMAPPTIRHLLARGDRLVLSGRNAGRLAELEGEFGGSGRVVVVAADVTDPEGARALVAEAAERMGALDGLVHLVGSFRAGPLVGTPAAGYEELWRANFLSAVNTTAALLPKLTGGGRLVFFGTPLAAEPLPGLSAYAASKAALLAWVRSVSHEVKGRGVHLNAIVMTMADTPQARRERPHVDFGEAVDPELVARAVGFLTSAAADGLYGSLVPVLGRFGFRTPLADGPPGRGPAGHGRPGHGHPERGPAGHGQAGPDPAKHGPTEHGPAEHGPAERPLRPPAVTAPVGG